MMNEPPLILTINEAHYEGDYRIRVHFNSGEEKILDFHPIIKEGRGITRKLADIDYFRSFTLDPFTIDWHNEIGFSPEYLHQLRH